MKKKSRRSLLHVLASEGCCEGMTKLLEQGADPSSRGPQGRSPLHCAAASGSSDDAERLDLDSAFATCMNMLVSKGADPNARDDKGNTPLALAVKSGRLGCVRALLECGADARSSDDRGDTPLHVASRYRRIDCLELLLKAQESFDVETRQRYSYCPASEECAWESLRDAAASLDVDRMSRLLASGYNPNEGRPLHVVCENERRDTTEVAIRLLCDFGADLDARDAAGNTPLHVAAKASNKTSVAALLQAGADASASNDAGSTPLHLARTLVVSQLLVEYGAPRIETQRDEDAEMLEDDVFFDAIIGSPPPPSVETTGFSSREQRKKQDFRDPNGDSSNPLYVSSPEAPSPHQKYDELSPEVKRDIDAYARKLKQRRGRQREHPSPVSAAGSAAFDIMRGLENAALLEKSQSSCRV